MDLKLLLKWPLMMRVVLRAFMLLLAVIVVSLMQMCREAREIEPIIDVGSNSECGLIGLSCSTSNSPISCEERENVTKAVFGGLMEMNFLQSNARALCIGEKSASAVLALRHLGFFNVFGVHRHPFFSLLKRRIVSELNFDDDSFDFVFSENLARVSFPALLLLEIERVLRPGGTGAMLVGRHEFSSASLKSSDVVHICGVGSSTLVIFKKKLSFEHFQLPAICPSVANNKPFMKFIEPLTTGQFEPKLSYLPDSMNISSRNKLIHINLGAGEYAKTSVAKMFKPYCGNHHSSFEVFIIDHKTSVLSSYVTDPGINFVYYPALAGDTAPPDITSDEFLSAPMDEEGFDFVPWFKETVSDGDFVVLMMKANLVELNILVELFKTGAICRVDELFLRCGGCAELLENLRKSGVYAHQWYGD